MVAVKWSSREELELGQVLEMSDKGDWEEIAKKELDCDMNSSRVIWSYSETVINPLPGYDHWRLRILVHEQRWTGKCVE
jgi:hypothetical protein